jgi:carbon monoxide dehydrogenase subunit G
MSVRVLISAAGAAILLAACVSLAPGADKVHVTDKASDVANCTAVGNLRISRDAQGQVDLVDADTEYRNQTVGLGGNTAFVTSSVLGQGIGYRCP